MDTIISVHIEDAPKGVFLCRTIDTTIETEKGSIIQGFEIIRPYKKVIQFTQFGNMHIRYYMKHEWDCCYNAADSDIVSSKFEPVALTHTVFLNWFNAQLAESSLTDILDDIILDRCHFRFSDLAPASNRLYTLLRSWNHQEPLQGIAGVHPVCEKFKNEDGTEFWDLMYFEKIM